MGDSISEGVIEEFLKRKCVLFLVVLGVGCWVWEWVNVMNVVTDFEMYRPRRLRGG